MSSKLTALSLVVGVLFLAGCGHKAKVVPVSGLVTLDGMPLANAEVQFQPMATDGNSNPGYGSFGKTDAQGRFTLTIASQETQAPGAVAGMHKVTIASGGTEKVAYDPQIGSPDGGGPKNRPQVEKLPANYNSQSSLTFEVPVEGTDKANFDLKSR